MTKSPSDDQSQPVQGAPADNTSYQNSPMDVHATNRPVEELEVRNSIVDPNLPQDAQDKLRHIQGLLEKFKDELLAKFEGYISGIALLPPSRLEDGETIDQDTINALVLIDDSAGSKMSPEELKKKLSSVIDAHAEKIDKNLKPMTLLYSEVWQSCYDAKYELLQMIASSATIYDTGMLAAIKVTEIHKNMVLRKFEKYIVSYVLAGSLVQGKATSTSDVDVFIVIDDTDVKKMTRFELREKLRGIILGLAAEAGEITGVKNKLNIQIYILTDFWDSVKEANPVIFTFLRDGVPFFDRGIFMPWKQLLRMGRIRPSPEAIDIYMSSGDQALERVRMKMKEIGMEDFFWSVLTPTQAVLMMMGVPPPTPKETATVLKEVFVDKEKLLEKKYVDIIESIISTRKDLEHGTKTAVTGKELDKFYNDSKDYLQRIQTLAKEIEERSEIKSIDHLYDGVITMVRDALMVNGQKDVDVQSIGKVFEKELVNKGKIHQRYATLLEDIFSLKKQHDAGKANKAEIERVRKESSELSRVLIEFIQRQRARDLDRARIRVSYGDKLAEVYVLEEKAYVVMDVKSTERDVGIASIDEKGRLGKLESCTLEDFEHALAQASVPSSTVIREHLFEDLRSLFGTDVQIVLH